jgi:hypothetical protein
VADATENTSIKMDENRPSNGLLYPWYDSGWLSKYEEAKRIVGRAHPQKLPNFTEAFQLLRTRSDFKVKFLEQPFDASTFAEIKRVSASLHPMDLKLHETMDFGRFIVRNRPFFSELQERTIPWVSELVGEPVEASYNFLSLYTSKGVCAVHMDAPEAKYTLDLCIDQRAPWPIYFSEVQQWPESAGEKWKGDNWENNIKEKRSQRFTPYTLHPGQAVIFSGSSQWHYRDPMPESSDRNFCNLLFFHYIPTGTMELVKPSSWARLFDIPELEGLADIDS